MLAWLQAFVVTVLVEVPLVTGTAPRALRGRAALDALLANLLTHPAAWLAIRSAGWSWSGVEVGVAVVEALVYGGVTRLPWRRAVAAAVVANAVTAALSFVL